MHEKPGHRAQSPSLIICLTARRWAPVPGNGAASREQALTCMAAAAIHLRFAIAALLRLDICVCGHQNEPLAGAPANMNPPPLATRRRQSEQIPDWHIPRGPWHLTGSTPIAEHIQR
jgi:hypothetical protein